MAIFDALVLLLAANGAPIIAWRILGGRWDYPIDAGARFSDDRPLFGPSKTVRGAIAAVFATAVAGVLLGYSPGLGAAFGGLAILGDLLSSFIKRRVGIVSSGMALGLDQVPESLLPLLVLQPMFDLNGPQILLTVAVFFVGELLLSRVLFRLHLRKTPY